MPQERLNSQLNQFTLSGRNSCWDSCPSSLVAVIDRTHLKLSNESHFLERAVSPA